MRGTIGKLARAALVALPALAGTGDARAATDWLQYIASHGDLIRAFGTDEAAGEQHFRLFGRAESRPLDAFDEGRYLANYPDLQAAFGADTRAATVHYILYGFAEGRTDEFPAAPGRSILLIVADDFGVDVAEFYPATAGRRATTPPAPPMPNLVRLAGQGVLFRDAWANMECSPTRATILTGRYGFRTEIGRLLEGVDLGATTVIFVGDNGTPGEVNAPPYVTGKSSIYEGGIRVPLLIAGAGVVSPGRVADGLVNTVDLYPTILRLAGIDPEAVVPPGTRLDGVSLLPYLEGATGGAPRPAAYSEKFHLDVVDRYQRAIRNASYKLIERAGGKREFYNLRADPFETTDLLLRPLTAAESGNLTDLQGRLGALLATR